MRRLNFPYWRKCAHKIAEDAEAVRVSGLRVGYGAAQGSVFDGADLVLQKGEKGALVGPNGAGKSTFLKVLAGLLPSSGGRIRLMGHPVSACQHYMTYLPQSSEIDWEFPISVRKLILSGAYIRLGWVKRPGGKEFEEVERALELLGLGEVADRQIGELSVGQQQRALLARCLVHDAELFLLDEPLNAVDVETKGIIRTVFDQLKGEGKSLLIATHESDAEDFDRVFRVEGGKIDV